MRLLLPCSLLEPSGASGNLRGASPPSWDKDFDARWYRLAATIPTPAWYVRPFKRVCCSALPFEVPLDRATTYTQLTSACQKTFNKPTSGMCFAVSDCNLLTHPNRSGLGAAGGSFGAPPSWSALQGGSPHGFRGPSGSFPAPTGALLSRHSFQLAITCSMEDACLLSSFMS